MVGSTANSISKSVPAVTGALEHLQTLGIVTENSGRNRNLIFFYQKCLDLIGTGTEPLP